MMINRILHICIVLVGFMLTAQLGASAEAEMHRAIKNTQANVIFMRHALAPGTGDPANFTLGDCNTQRNLNDQGRAQAVEIGRRLRAMRVEFSTIFTSQWCRCWQTAELLKLGMVEPFAGLNSFFQSHADREETLALLRERLGHLPDGLTLMVTHQVVIRAITGFSVGSGKFVAFNTQTGKAEAFALN